MKKGFFLTGIGLLFLSFLLSLMEVMWPMLLVCKYLGMAFGITLMTYALISSHIHRTHKGLAWIGYAILMAYTLLTVDTFLFHAISWIPGIIRYPIYSLYGVPYLAFILPGWLLCYHNN